MKHFQTQYYCPTCRNPVEKPWYPCDGCRDKALRKIGPSCCQCGMDLAGADNPCPHCRDEKSFLDGLITVGAWNGPLREWLSAFKYGGDVRMANWLAELLSEFWSEYYNGIPVVPVPPRPGKIRREGRDQISVLAKRMSRRGIPVYPLLRRLSGVAQKTLSRKQRLSGDSLSFKMRAGVSIPNRVLVVLDDVATTGSTLGKCAEILKQNGAMEVHGLVLCRD